MELAQAYLDKWPPRARNAKDGFKQGTATNGSKETCFTYKIREYHMNYPEPAFTYGSSQLVAYAAGRRSIEFVLEIIMDSDATYNVFQSYEIIQKLDTEDFLAKNAQITSVDHRLLFKSEDKDYISSFITFEVTSDFILKQDS